MPIGAVATSGATTIALGQKPYPTEDPTPMGWVDVAVLSTKAGLLVQEFDWVDGFNIRLRGDMAFIPL